MPDYLLTLTLNEPLTVGQRPVISNEIQTLEYIPATTLRGSLACALALAGRGTELEAWFGTGGPWWTPAYPQGAGGSLAVPLPACFVHEKGDPPFEGQYCVASTLFGPPPADAGEYNALTGENAAPHRFQWSGVRGKWLQTVAGKAVGLHHVALDATMHVGLHYGRQANRKEALFSRREIAAGTVFQAWVHDPAGVLNHWPDELFLGKRRSAGNGNVALACQAAGLFPWAGAPLAPNYAEVNLQLVTDAVVREDYTAAYRRGIAGELWSQWIGTKCEVMASAATSRLVMGWSGGAGLAREQALAIAAGAVYRLACRGDLAVFHAGLARLADRGIGEGRHEGCGWLAVNPPWLDSRMMAPQARQAPQTKTGPDDWPGLEGVPHAELEALLTAAQQVRYEGQNRNEFQKKVEQLAAYAARAQTAAAVADYAEALGRRVHDRGWKEISDKLAAAVRQQGSAPKVLFYLAAVKTYLGREERSI